jgi:peptidyl-prolyl cis-trans isomerase C
MRFLQLIVFLLAMLAPQAADLFGDQIVARGKGFEIKQSQVDELFISFKANRAAAGQNVPEDMRVQAEADILDRLIATQVLLQRATPEDRKNGLEVAAKFLEEQRKLARSEDSFRRQLLASGMSVEQFEAQIKEQAIVKTVIDRELKSQITITPEQIKKYYDENPKLFIEPEKVRVAHVLISTRDAMAQDLPPEQRLEKKKLADRVLQRAKAGENFERLVKEFSEDMISKEKGGEYTIIRNPDGRANVLEFEAAAFTLNPDQISDLVTTRFGYHIIKLLERTPEQRQELAKVESQIREILLQEGVQKNLAAHLAKLRKEMGVEVLAPQFRK